VTGLWYDDGFGSGSDDVLSILLGSRSDLDTTEIYRIGSSSFNICTTLTEGRAGRLHYRTASWLLIKLGCRKGQAGGMPFSPACPAFLYSPLARPSVFCAACQSADSSRYSFGNTVLQPPSN